MTYKDLASRLALIAIVAAIALATFASLSAVSNLRQTATEVAVIG